MRSIRGLVVIVAVASMAAGCGASQEGSSAPTSTDSTRPIDSVPAPQTTDPAAPGTTVPESDLTAFVDDASGFRMMYPTAWSRRESVDSTVVIDRSDQGLDPVSLRFTGLLDLSAGDHGSVRVEFDRTAKPTYEAELTIVKPITDLVVSQDQAPRVLRQRQITVDGMPGNYYFSTFTDESGQEGACSRYFLFRGDRMYIVTLRAVPSDEFAPLAGVFDQIVDTIRTTR